MKGTFDSLRAGFKAALSHDGGASSSSSSSSSSPSVSSSWSSTVPLLSRNAVLFTEHVRHTARLYLFLGVAGVCVSPLVYVAVYGVSRQNRGALIDAAASFEDDPAGSQETTAAKKRTKEPQATTAVVKRAADQDEEAAPTSGDEDADLVISAKSRALVIAAVGRTEVSASTTDGRLSAPPQFYAPSTRGQAGVASPGQDPQSSLTRLSHAFFRTVLSVKHASNHVFGSACAASVLPPYYAALARYVVRGLVVNVTVHALVFGTCAVLDACLPLSYSAPSSSSPSSSSSVSPAVPTHEGLLLGLKTVLGGVWTGLRHGRPVLSMPSPGSLNLAEATHSDPSNLDATSLPFLVHPSWTALYDFVSTARFAPIGYWSVSLMRVCGLWWCVCGRSSSPWQRGDRSAVAAATETWRHLTSCGLFLVGALSAMHVCMRRMVNARRGRGQKVADATGCDALQPFADERDKGEEGATANKTMMNTPTNTTQSRRHGMKDASAHHMWASRCPRVSRAIVALWETVVTALLHGLGLVITDYVIGSLHGGAGRTGGSTSGKTSPPVIAVLFSVLSLQ